MAENMSWWDEVLANVDKIKGEVNGLNGGKGGNPFPDIPVQSLASLMPKNTQPFPMGTPGVVQDFLDRMPKNPNWNPMAGSPPMKTLGELMPQKPQPFPLPSMQSWSSLMPANPQPFPVTFGKK